MFSVLNAIFICLSLNRFVIFLVSFPFCVEVVYFVLRCCEIGIFRPYIKYGTYIRDHNTMGIIRTQKIGKHNKHINKFNKNNLRMNDANIVTHPIIQNTAGTEHELAVHIPYLLHKSRTNYTKLPGQLHRAPKENQHTKM